MSGYLGSGKTSFIKSFIDDYEGKVALLINDFSRVNIDALELEGISTSMVELTNGSIFCSCLKEDFIDSLAMLLEYEKDIVLIEGSGLADPSNMQDVIEILAGKIDRSFSFLGSVCILDGQYFLREVLAMESVVRQVAHSQLALLNKIDLIDDRVKEAVRAKAQAINPDLTIIETSFGGFPAGDIIRILKSHQDITQSQESLNTPENRPLTINADFIDLVNLSELQRLVKKLLPETDRMKGYVMVGQKFYKVESVQHTLEIRLANRSSIDACTVVIFLKDGLTSFREIQKMGLQKVRVKL